MPIPQVLPLSPVTSSTVAPLPAVASDRAIHRLDHLAPSAPIGLDSASADVVLFKRMLRGELDVAEGLTRVAANQGWPIETDTGYIVACPANGAGVRLAGSFNDWRPQPMNRNGELCWAIIPRQEATLRYKLVDDSGFHADPWSRRYYVDDYGEYSLARSPGAHLERWFGVTDGTVRPRTVRVWVPRDTPTHHLYAHDGQSTFGGGWELDRQVGPHTLVIGIETIDGRFEDLTPMTDTLDGKQQGGGGAAYADFVEKYLRPRMETRYGRPQTVGVMGASLGGVMAVYQAWRFPQAYDFAMSLSGTFGWGSLEQHGESLIDWYRRSAPGRAKLYIDSGGNPDAGDNYDHNRQFADVLRERGWQHGQNLFYWHEAGAPHHHSAWRARLHRPLGLFEGR